MFKDLSNELTEIPLESNTLQREIRFAVELRHLHLLALVADRFSATLPTVELAAALEEDAAHLDVGAFAGALGAEDANAGLTVQGGVLVHAFGAVEVVVIVNLHFLSRVFDQIFRQPFKRAVEASVGVDVVAPVDVSWRFLTRRGKPLLLHN